MPRKPSKSPQPGQRAVRLVGDSNTGLKPAYDASWALVIGIDNYQNAPKLKYAVGDAIGMATLLVEHLGFRSSNVLALLDPPPTGDLPFKLLGGEASKGAIEEQLYTLLPDQVGPDDRVLIFFAGHGESRDLPGGKKKGYLVPATGEPGQWHTLIAMDDLAETGELLRGKHVFYLLDACFSGLATARSGSAPTRYQADMLTSRARQVLTAGTARQAVADAGPGGHSLFTGYVINGLRGDAAQANSTAITASDLMVYVKNQVAQAGDSQQTPDFGTLPGHESGGDFVFVLPPEADDYQLAVTALGQGQLTSFRTFTTRAMGNRPLAAETIYLEYRLRLLENDIDAATGCIDRLLQTDRTRSKVPLSDNDLNDLAAMLPFWNPVLQLPEGEPPLTISLWAGPDANTMAPVAPKTLEVAAGTSFPLFELPTPGVGQWRVANRDTRPWHIYFTQFTADGRLEVGPLLTSTTAILFTGLGPGQGESSDYFPLAAAPSLIEMRLFAAPDTFKHMISPTNFNARALMRIDEAALQKLALFQRATRWCRTVDVA